jgi:uncharacterized protein (DUF305 family)
MIRYISALVLGLFLCAPAMAGVEPDYKPGAPVVTPVYANQGTAEQKADMDFIKGMRPHHAGALSMSKEYLASKTASNAKLTSLAKGIITNQEFEIGMLDKVESYVSKPLAEESEFRQVALQGLAQQQKFIRAPMPSSFGVGDTAVTKRDVEFAKAMIVHHEGALTMANDYLANPAAKNPYLRLMCLDILKDQKMEIAFMHKIISYYPGNPDDVKIDPSMVHGMEGMSHGKSHDGKKCEGHGKKHDMKHDMKKGMDHDMGEMSHGEHHH